MLIIQKLYIKDFLRVFIILSLGISLIFSIISLIDKIDDFVSAEGAFFILLTYTIYNTPKYFNYILPMSILLSSLFIFSQAANRREIVAIKSAGAKISRIFLPFLIIGILLSLFSFFLSEIVIPALSKEIQSIKNQLTKKGSNITFKEGSVFMKGKDGSIVRITLYLDDKDISHGVSIYKYDEEGLKEKIDAEVGQWDGQSWILKNVNIFNVLDGKSIFVKEIYADQIESPKILKKQILKSEEMTIIELIQYDRRLNRAGFKNPKLVVDISSRFSYPLINFFMIILGLSLSIGAENRLVQKVLSEKLKGKQTSGGGVFIAGLGLLLSLIYWLGHSFFLSLGYAGTISPAISAWIMPIFFAICSIYLYRQIPE